MTILGFRTKLAKKVTSSLNWKTEHHHWILHIEIILGTKFQLKLTILSFWPELPEKAIPSLKQKKWTLSSAYSY